MLRAFSPNRSKSIRGTIAGFALAVALAGGVAMGSTAVTSDAAFAQENSRGFVEAYQPVAAMVSGETPDPQGAKAALPALYEKIENQNDRQVAGNITLILGNNTSDPVLQRRGLKMMLDSGLVAPEQLGQFNYFVGSLAYQAEDYAEARTALQAAKAAGYSDPETDITLLIADTYSQEGNAQGSLDYIMQAVGEAEAAGNMPTERWLLRALQSTYDAEMAERAVDVSEGLIRHYPTQTNWVNSLQVVNALNEYDPEARVDLYRLMGLTNSLTQRAEFVRYIEDLDPRVMSNEVQDILASGVTAGAFTTDDPYYVEVKGIADTRASQDRNGIEGMVSDGQSGDSLDALSAGDVLYSIGDFTRAESLYRVAMEKGADANLVNTRIGIAQAEQGNYAAAVDTFGMVNGTRSSIARMWAAYASSKM
ncbi:MAG: tetratricopeptide repeat protein [Alteraurantiacibacter sp.]